MNTDPDLGDPKPTLKDPRVQAKLEEQLRAAIQREKELKKSDQQKKVDAELLKKAKEARALKRLAVDLPEDWISAEDVPEGVLLMAVDLMATHLPMELTPESGKLGMRGAWGRAMARSADCLLAVRAG